MRSFNKVYFRLLLVLSVLLLLVFGGCQQSSEDLFEVFQEPPATARPFVRWWWNGSQVTEQEIQRELDVLKKAGIGGVEINPIAMPEDAVDIGAKPLVWLTPEWNHMVKVAADEARERGMITDMIVGTGWPFGGRFLPPDEQIKGVVVQQFELQGPMTFQRQLNDLIELKRKPAPGETAPEPQLLFLRLVPKNIRDIAQSKDLTGAVGQDGNIRFQVPEGNYLLSLGTIQAGLGFREVTLGAPGADGPCLDHYNSAAVTRYIDRVAEKLGPELGGRLGDALRALFVDSIELSGSDWTGDLLEQFRRRRGYDLEPYFPFVFYPNPQQGYKDAFEPRGALADTIKRVRYDYNKTLVELFLERFTETYHQWCQEQGAESRYQAYGTPWLMGMSEGYMIPDIPESNNWLFSPDPYSHGYYVWNKYTAAGAHLTGKPVASCEAMTDTRGVFKATLEMIKQADDMNFIMGINHSVLHGFNYSPPAAGFPGWVRFGAYFSEQNPWWPYFPEWVDYNARLSAVFQHSQPVMDVAVLTPRADIWSTTGLARVPLQTAPWYGPRLWESIHQNGLSADYISEKIIQDGTKKGGALRYGPMAYRTLILTGVQSLEPETATAIRDFAENGGRVIFIGEQPNRSLSLPNAVRNDATVQENVDRVLQEHPERAGVVPAPDRGEALHLWMRDLISRFQIEQPVRISPPDPALYQMHQNQNGKDLFFFVNNDKNRAVQFEAVFGTEDKTPWRWDPFTGTRSVYPYRESPDHLSITLQPLESLLLVFDPDRSGEPEPAPEIASQASATLSGPWECEFQPAHTEPFSRTLTRLTDFSESADHALNTFAGTVHYRTTFRSEESQPLVLDLGKVHGVAEVSLNGQSLGDTWWGRRRYDISDAVRSGDNTLDVKVTTVLYNYVQSMTENATARKWVRNQRDPSLAPAGMVGPVRLFGVRSP